MSKTLEEKIAETEAEIASLRAEKERLDSLGPEYRLAEELHTAQCTWNHTDGCGWFYEIDKGVAEWSRYSHAKYLKKACAVMALLPGFDTDEIIKVSKALRG